MLLVGIWSAIPVGVKVGNYNNKACRHGVLGYLKGVCGILRILSVMAILYAGVEIAFGQNTYSEPVGGTRARQTRSKVLRPSLALEALLAKARTPREVCDIVERFVRYRCDQDDEWQTPEETLRRRAGDCEDFTILVQHVCGQIGYPATAYFFFSYEARGQGHAVACGRFDDGRWWYSDNGGYYEENSFDDIRRSVARRAGWDADRTWYSALNGEQMKRRIVAAAQQCSLAEFCKN